ncbi:hypothetical protein HanIR_Chr05g0246781 [Helianthus annuus]|nr:hypothetical protein HanIR_Chr05g0246781 [Helianthus annuus]
MGDKSSIIWFITLVCRHHKTFRTPLHSCRRRTRSRRRTRTRRNSPETYGQQRESPPPFCFARVLVGSQPKTYGHRDRDHFISYRYTLLLRLFFFWAKSLLKFYTLSCLIIHTKGVFGKCYNSMSK